MFKIQKIHRWTPFLLVLLILASVLMPVLATKIAYADGQEGSFISDKVSGKVLDHQLYFFLKRCFIDINMDKVPSDEIDDWSWWKGSGDMGYRGDMYQNNYVKCSEGEWIEEAFSRFGFTDPLDTFCRLGFTYNRVTGGLGKTVDGGNTVEACKAGYDKGDFDGSDTLNQADELDKLLSTASNYTTAKGNLTDVQEYVRYYRTFMNGCQITLVQPYETGDASDNPRAYKVPVVNQDGSIEYWLGKATNPIIGSDGSSKVLVETLSGGPKTMTCGDLVKALRGEGGPNLTKAYADYLKTDGKDDTGSAEGGSGSSSGKGEKTCETEAGELSFILCPTLRLLDSLVDFLDQSIKDLLFVNKSVYDSENIRNTWAVMRNIALLILIPMMLLMVIGTALDFGPFDAYTVKKALPRMVFAVMFIVLSLYITQFGIQVSNAVGQGMGNLIMSVSNTKIDSLTDIFAQNGMETGDSVLFVGAVTALAGASLAGLLTIGILGSFAFVTVIALGIGFIILVMRQVLLMMLVVLSPLAILVWIFPGNDKLWAIWRTTFIAMLMMYPLISILIASGKFVAGIADF